MLAVLGGEEELPGLAVKPLREGRRHLPPADGVDVGILGKVEDLPGIVKPRQDVGVKPSQDQVVPLVNQDEEQVFGAGDVIEEELDPDGQGSLLEVNPRRRQGLVEGDLVDVLENFRDPLRPLAAVRPVAEDFITREGVNQQGRRPVQVPSP